MDVRVFSNENYDSNSWINSVLGDSGKAEVSASSLVMKLQLLIAKLNLNLEEQSASLLGNLPRTLREAESLNQETRLLKDKIKSVQSNIEESKENELFYLDFLKDKISTIRSAVNEADNWNELTLSVEQSVKDGSFLLVVDKFHALQSSLKILSHVPDFESRIQKLENLKNFIEIQASPDVTKAFEVEDTNKIIFFVSVFDAIGRKQELLKYFRKNLGEKLLKKWVDIVEKKDDDVTLWASSFFGFVHKKIADQSEWFERIFSDFNVAENMFEVIKDVHSKLDPAMSFCIEASLKKQTKHLEYLIELKAIFNNHLKEICEIFSKHIDCTRLYFIQMAKTIFAPFKQYIFQYPRYELSKLQSDVLEEDNSKDLLSDIRQTSKGTQKLISALESASERCCALTEATEYSGFVQQTVKSIVSSYIERYNNLFSNLNKQRKTSQHWSIVKQTLHLNQIAGELLLKMEDLEITLSMHFVERAKSYFDDENIINQHHLFLLDGVSIKKLQEFYDKITQGGGYPILGDSIKLIHGMLEKLQSSTFDILFETIQDELRGFCSLDAWKREDSQDVISKSLPSFGFSPQEYITHIGQYLMTLPQHLEPYMSDENVAISRALEERLFPYCQKVPINNFQPVDFILGCMSAATCEIYAEEIMKLNFLSSFSSKQLSTDIGYLSDILEDLGHSLTDNLKSLLTLLKTPYKELANISSKHPSKIITFMLKVKGN